jgi:hypothetical protein
MAFFVAAGLLFIAFHFLPLTGQKNLPGWEVWGFVRDAFEYPFGMLRKPFAAIVVVSFLSFSILITACPFVGSVLEKSRLGWWLAVVFSIAASGGFWGVLLVSGNDMSCGPGGFCLIMAPLLNFVGLLLARKRP